MEGEELLKTKKIVENAKDSVIEGSIKEAKRLASKKPKFW